MSRAGIYEHDLLTVAGYLSTQKLLVTLSFSRSKEAFFTKGILEETQIAKKQVVCITGDISIRLSRF